MQIILTGLTLHTPYEKFFSTNGPQDVTTEEVDELYKSLKTILQSSCVKLPFSHSVFVIPKEVLKKSFFEIHLKEIEDEQIGSFNG